MKNLIKIHQIQDKIHIMFLILKDKLELIYYIKLDKILNLININ
jgi:hypothetical protein